MWCVCCYEGSKVENCNLNDRMKKRSREMPLNRAIYFLARNIQHVANRIPMSYGVTWEQLYVLQCLAEGNIGYPQWKICRRTKKTPTNVVRILDRLEGKFLVLRQSSSLDRRTHI